MKNPFPLILPSLFIACLLALASCDNKATPGEEDAAITLAPPDVREFYHAWLADCVNEVVKDSSNYWNYDPTSKLISLATQRINDALGDIRLNTVIGEEQLVWGPALVVDYDGEGTLFPHYVSKNLMFAVRSISPSKDTAYHIGIAGTNMISHYDWFTEDLQVDNMVHWHPGGKISQGSMIGIQKLDTLKSQGQTLLEYLHQETQGKKNTTIHVAGHSLGGAMTQVYSSFLKSNLSGPKVEAWVYAGPTAGNDVFATTLTSHLDGYHAYNNTRDLVPHAWQQDSLAKLCDIYDGLPLCDGTLGNENAINGIIKYLQLTANNNTNNYTIPGTPTTFTADPASIDVEDCAGYVTWIESLILTDVHSRMEELSNRCSGGDNFTNEEYRHFFFYLAEMGTQHTTAYVDHFFDFGGKHPNFKGAVREYVSGAEYDVTELENADQGKLLIEDLLNNANIALAAAQVTDCSCQ